MGRAEPIASTVATRALVHLGRDRCRSAPYATRAKISGRQQAAALPGRRPHQQGDLPSPKRSVAFSPGPPLPYYHALNPRFL